MAVYLDRIIRSKLPIIAAHKLDIHLYAGYVVESTLHVSGSTTMKWVGSCRATLDQLMLYSNPYVRSTPTALSMLQLHANTACNPVQPLLQPVPVFLNGSVGYGLQSTTNFSSLVATFTYTIHTNWETYGFQLLHTVQRQLYTNS